MTTFNANAGTSTAGTRVNVSAIDYEFVDAYGGEIGTLAYHLRGGLGEQGEIDLTGTMSDVGGVISYPRNRTLTAESFTADRQGYLRAVAGSGGQTGLMYPHWTRAKYQVSVNPTDLHQIPGSIVNVKVRSAGLAVSIAAALSAQHSGSAFGAFGSGAPGSDASGKCLYKAEYLDPDPRNMNDHIHFVAKRSTRPWTSPGVPPESIPESFVVPNVTCLLSYPQRRKDGTTREITQDATLTVTASNEDPCNFA